MVDQLLSLWSLDDGSTGVGNVSLLDQPLSAFFASRQCSGSEIRTALDWAVEHASQKKPIISCFHSSLEQSVLKIMLTASAPCVIVVARQFEQTRLPSAWLTAARKGTVAIVGMENTTKRLTTELAAKRNIWIAQRAIQIVVVPSPEGLLQQQSAQWSASGLEVIRLSC